MYRTGQRRHGGRGGGHAIAVTVRNQAQTKFLSAASGHRRDDIAVSCRGHAAVSQRYGSWGSAGSIRTSSPDRCDRRLTHQRADVTVCECHGTRDGRTPCKWPAEDARPVVGARYLPD